MQYIKCRECIYGGGCQVVMANAMAIIHDLERLINAQTAHKCNLKIDYSCENFTPIDKENVNV